MSWIRGQQDAPSLRYTLYINMLTVTSGVSILGRQWQPLSAHCTLPIEIYLMTPDHAVLKHVSK